MDPIALQFANGNFFFVGLAMTVAAASIFLWGSRRIFVLGAIVLSVCGLSLVILSATPLPLWLNGIWLSLGIAVLFGEALRFLSFAKVGITAAFAITSLIMCLLELPYHITPTIPIFRSQPVFVIGDSISAGVNLTNNVPWPTILGNMSHLKVTNLAKPGATTESALNQVARISDSSALVIIEIGGNDLLSGADGTLFSIQLEKLLDELKQKHARIVMFELPLFPFHNDFGKTQRLLAKKYGATLIPKGCLTRVLGLNGGTIDGLHLSDKGHDELAKTIFGMVRIEEIP